MKREVHGMYPFVPRMNSRCLPLLTSSSRAVSDGNKNYSPGAPLYSRRGLRCLWRIPWNQDGVAKPFQRRPSSCTNRISATQPGFLDSLDDARVPEPRPPSGAPADPDLDPSHNIFHSKTNNTYTLQI